ncbi:hypothetical protein Pst134EA_031681 [Puccinia striiformis f. sp. tritici]|uniref:uncharacterized protein n=1 Tax=Puccinia striiformis f. sp. tritici TaxID=168172 RepID=UPI0020075FDD|nr:uncharacterized protein Pst134EA_031681 [Puccinia striiformis f. sp. tritici]KAH9442667.1 hypothetical protein Pst134EA_031681 [Puccinia striiformis f. sp. tritici]
MFLTRSEYDRGVNTFSPEGRLFQVEYAIEAIKLGSTTIAATTSEGVILGVERRSQSKLLEASSIEKIMEIDSHLGCAIHFDEPIKTESVTHCVCDLALRFGESTHDEDAMMSRPFGVALYLSRDAMNLTSTLQADPSGISCDITVKHRKWIGRRPNRNCKNVGIRCCVFQWTLWEAKLLVLQTLRSYVMEEKLDEHNVQLAQVTPNGGFHILTNAELQESVTQMPVENNPVLSSLQPQIG